MNMLFMWVLSIHVLVAIIAVFPPDIEPYFSWKSVHEFCSAEFVHIPLAEAYNRFDSTAEF